jgi:hypothetical protein
VWGFGYVYVPEGTDPGAAATLPGGVNRDEAP